MSSVIGGQVPAPPAPVPVYDVGSTFFFAIQTVEEGRWTRFRADNGWSFFGDLYLEKVVAEGEGTR